MRKRYFLLYLAALLFLLSTASPIVYAAEPGQPYPATKQSDFEIEGTVLTAYYGTSAEVIVPQGVTEIGSWCFDGNQTIQKVTLPNTVQMIDYCAFYNTSLKEIVLSTGLKEVGDSAFLDSELSKISLPEGLEIIGEEAFWCEKLSRICIPRSVKEIGNNAFSFDARLECYKGTVGFAYAKKYHADNSIVLDAEKNFSDLQFSLSQHVYDGNPVRPVVTVRDCAERGD